ncbi:MAG TPA: GAF domain-containing protein, partial [Gemmatimonadaceae bacterium]|nr:GAF domain-containing protein [Gemmatimonadaceae bacterium]
MRPLLLASRGGSLDGMELGHRRTDIEAHLVHSLPDVAALDLDRPVLILLDRGLLDSVPDAAERVRRLATVAAIVGCGAPGELEPGDDLPVEHLTAFLPADASSRAAALLVGGAMRHAVALCAERLARRDAERRRLELAELTDVGVALATRRDLLSLLELILTHARRLTSSDAGSLYLVEPVDAGAADDGGTGTRMLRFKLAQNFSRPELQLGEVTLPIDGASLAGWAAASGEVIAVPDVYAMGADGAFRQNRSFDARLGYRTKSVLVMPLRTHRGITVGVLQLINRKRAPTALLGNEADVDREVLPFDRRCIELVGALAAQAAVAIENGALSERIERLFEGFVTASVTAIESRDPSTFGHSARVAALSVALAEALEHHPTGRYAHTR